MQSMRRKRPTGLDPRQLLVDHGAPQHWMSHDQSQLTRIPGIRDSPYPTNRFARKLCGHGGKQR